MSELRPPASPRRHLLSIADLDRHDVERILDTARSLAGSLEREVKKLPTLRGRTVVNLFYESSTRTLASFELAAKRLSADTMSLRSAGSSVDKGESLKDTALTLAAYEPDVIVVRHPSIGAPQLVARLTDAHVVNAGDGKHQHPTQALLDLHTMRQALGRLDGLHVAIVGDVLHSRVARSLVQALGLVGARATLVGPPTLLPRGIESLGCDVSYDVDVIADADVVYVLRMQQERMGEAFVPSLREYTAVYGITPERVREGQVVMHPGPMNRGVEIDPRVADSTAALVTDQVRAGLVVRMAVLYDVLTVAPVPERERWPDARRAERPERLARAGGPRAGTRAGNRRAAEDHHQRRSHFGARARRAGRGGDRAGLRRPARPPAHAGTRGRGDATVGDGGCSGRRLLRDPRDAEHGARRRFGRSARSPRRGRARRGGRADRLHGGDQQGPAGR
jgi:aspartate carbamoyltransferase catalytic subunit